MNVLEWFKNSGYEFKYDEELLNKASISLNMIRWFEDSEYTKNKLIVH
jgi:hypothetical protein